METVEKNRQAEELDIRGLLGILVHNWGFIAAIGLAMALAGYLISIYVIVPTYESTTKIYILNKQENMSVTYSDMQMGMQLTKDYAQLVTSRYVLEQVSRELKLQNSYEQLQRKISVTSPADTRILSITVSDPNPQQAKAIADKVRDVSAGHIENVMEIEAVNIVEEANLPKQMASPNHAQWAIVGGISGGTFVMLVVMIRFMLNDTIITADDVEKHLNLSTLAVIPKAETGKHKAKASKKRKTCYAK